MKTKISAISAAASLILTACAGGGMAEPKVPVAIPTAQPVANPTLSAENGNIVTLNTNAAKAGRLQEDTVKIKGYGDFTYDENRYLYQTPSGNYYLLNSFSDPMTPSYASPSYAMRTKHNGQPLSEGGRLFVCCSSAGQFTYAPATKQDHLKFGAWINADGETDLFVGGKPVGTAKPSYFAPSDSAVAKGKTTYEVWAVRVRNGNFVTSTYEPAKTSWGSSEKPAAKLSLLTANFNTNKLGGTIVGNADYGADVVMKDVDINGTNFSGTAESDGKNGRVEGGFFGQFAGDATEVNIGGKVTFDADKSLDTVFGGVKNAADRDTADTTLTPVGQ